MFRFMVWPLLLGGVLLGFQGCVFKRDVSEAQYQQAQDLVRRGTELLRAGKTREAKTAYTAAAELAPLAAALDGQGCVAVMSGDYVAAESFFSKAFKIDSDYTQALGNLALLMDITGKYERAELIYATLRSRTPADIAIRNNQAALEYDRGQRKMLIVDELEKLAVIKYHPVIGSNLDYLKGLKAG